MDVSTYIYIYTCIYIYIIYIHIYIYMSTWHTHTMSHKWTKINNADTTRLRSNGANPTLLTMVLGGYQRALLNVLCISLLNKHVSNTQGILLFVSTGFMHTRHVIAVYFWNVGCWTDSDTSTWMTHQQPSGTGRLLHKTTANFQTKNLEFWNLSQTNS